MSHGVVSALDRKTSGSFILVVKDDGRYALRNSRLITTTWPGREWHWTYPTLDTTATKSRSCIQCLLSFLDTHSLPLSFRRYINPLTPTVTIWVQHPVPDRVKPSFVIFDIRTLWRSGLSVIVPGSQKLQMTA